MSQRRNPPTWIHPHPIKGKKRDEHVAMTYVKGFDQSTRRLLGEHYSFTSALNQFVRFCQYYYRQQRLDMWTAMTTGQVLWDTNAFIDAGIYYEKTTSKVFRQLALADLQRRLTYSLAHCANCSTRFDQMCDCPRAQLKQLVTELRPLEGRKIRRKL